MDQLVFRSRYGYQESSLGIEIPVTLGFAPTQFVSFLAKVDTGAECCIFQREHGDALGIPIETVTLACFEHEFETMVYFAQAYDFPRNVLGLRGWIDRLRIGLIHYDRQLFLSGYDD